MLILLDGNGRLARLIKKIGPNAENSGKAVAADTSVEHINTFSVFYVIWLAGLVLALCPSAIDSFAPVQELVLVLGAAIAGFLLTFRSYLLLKLPRIHNKLPWCAWVLLLPIGISGFQGLILGIEVVRLSTGLAWWAAMFVVAILPTQLAENERIMLLRAWVVIGAVEALVVLLQAAGFDPMFLVVGRFDCIWRVYGTLGNPNIVAPLLVPLALITLDRKLFSSSVIRMSLLILISLAVVLTGSRAAVLVLAVGFTVLAFVQNRSMSGTSLLVLLCALSGMVVLSFMVGSMMGKGFSSPFGRLFFWDVARHLIIEKPWSGFGWGSFEVAYLHGLDLIDSVRMIPEALPVHPDNDWLEFGVEFGILGLAPFFVSTWLIYATWKNIALRPLTTALSSMVVLSCFYAPLHTAASALLFWTLFGLLAMMRVRSLTLNPKGTFVLLLIGFSICILNIEPLWNHLQGNIVAAQAEELELGHLNNKAIKKWKLAWQLSPSEGEFAFRAAYLLAQEKNYHEALYWADLSSKTYSNFNLYTLHAWLLASLGRMVEAGEQLKWIEEKFPELQKPKELHRAILNAKE